jgi:hypothetical protein
MVFIKIIRIFSPRSIIAHRQGVCRIKFRFDTAGSSGLISSLNKGRNCTVRIIPLNLIPPDIRKICWFSYDLFIDAYCTIIQ